VNLVDRGGRCSSNVPFYDAYGWMGGMFDWNYQMVLNSMMNSMMSGGINGEQAVSTLSGYENMCVPIYESQYPIPSGGGSTTPTQPSINSNSSNNGSTSTNSTAPQHMSNIVYRAMSALASHPDCLALFNITGNGTHPSVVLHALLYETKTIDYGRLTFDAIAPLNINGAFYNVAGTMGQDTYQHRMINDVNTVYLTGVT